MLRYDWYVTRPKGWRSSYTGLAKASNRHRDAHSRRLRLTGICMYAPAVDISRKRWLGGRRWVDMSRPAPPDLS